MKLGMEKRIIYLRKKSGKSQSEIAKSIYLSNSHLSNIEAGRYELTTGVIQLLAKRFEVSTDYFKLTPNSPELAKNLEVTFSKILLDDDRDISLSLFENLPDAISFEQELAWKILEVIFYYKQHEFEKAKAIKKNYLSVFLEEIEIEQLPRYLQKYYTLYKFESHYKQSEFSKCYEFLEGLSKLLAHQNHQVKVTLMQTELFISLEQYGKAFVHIGTAIDLLKDTEDYPLLAKSLILKSVINLKLGLYDEVHLIIQELEAFITKHNLTEFRGFIFQHKGFVYEKSHQFYEALSNYEQAYYLAEKAELVIECLISIISCHIKLKNLEKARHYLDATSTMTLSKTNEMILLSLESELFLYQEKIKEHRSSLKKVFKYFKSIQVYEDLAYIYDYLANYYLEKKSYKNAAFYYHKKEMLKVEKEY